METLEYPSVSVNKQLPDVVPFFMQNCPLCSQPNRMILRGLYIHKDKVEKYPDIGYSFCNCRSIFYTNIENVTVPILDTFVPGLSTMPDPYFVDWRNPHTWLHWQPRKYQILWDMDSYCEEAVDQGYEVVSAIRDMDVESSTPQHFHVTLRKP